MTTERRTRNSIVDGIFYPDDPEELRERVSKLLGACGEPPGSAAAIVSPHAGYDFAGRYMASAYNAAALRRITRVVLLAPVHREPTDDIVLTDSEQFTTPLGPIPVDIELIHDMETCSTKMSRNDIPHLEEHAIEVHLPFVQTLFPEASIVPVLMGRVARSSTEVLNKTLRAVFDGRFDTTLFVASSNLSRHRREDEAALEASRFLDLAQKRDWQALVAAYDAKQISACGAGCIAALMAPGMPDWQVRILSQGSAEPEAKGYDQFVHYGAMAFEE